MFRTSFETTNPSMRVLLSIGLIALFAEEVCGHFRAPLGSPAAAMAHGFNANWVHITRLPSGVYRVLIKYTHVEAGEFREAHIDFAKKQEALDAYQKLVQGADFFLGDVKKSIHFHTPPEKPDPY
jgi:hypothetical protein